MPREPLLQPDESSEPAAAQEPAGELEGRVTAAYKDLSVKPRDWVRLSKLREKLGNPDKAEMDRILLAMVRTGLVHLAPSSNRKALTDDDHAAAFRIGGQDKHLLAIEPDYWDQPPGPR